MTSVSDLNAFRTAWELIKQFGGDAPIIAAQRADALLEQGDHEGSLVWRGVLRAVNELRNTNPTGTLQ